MKRQNRQSIKLKEVIKLICNTIHCLLLCKLTLKYAELGFFNKVYGYNESSVKETYLVLIHRKKPQISTSARVLRKIFWSEILILLGDC